MWETNKRETKTGLGSGGGPDGEKSASLPSKSDREGGSNYTYGA